MDTTLSRTPQSNACIDAHPTDAEALIGPNAVTRTLEAVTERLGGGIAKTLREAAGVPASIPEVMIPEQWFERLVAELRSRTSEATSREILHAAGAATAAYVRRNRIPAPARGLLRVLPARMALPILLAAVRRHAWTFAGRGTFAHVDGHLVLSDPPTCRAASEGHAAPDSHTPGTVHEPARSRGLGGAYYEAAFEGILSLAAPDVRVREVACIRAGAPACRFRLDRLPRHT
ncbi:MAG TPA: bacteriochlorophyll 4-vinyl reductase [Longimicrobiales bacterium]|nr:bacteriochlorophyll 4-vinyl reductase [Longimicrobiales bacterium]